MPTPKPSGHPCPSCGEPFPAEFAQMNQPAKWECHGCGATGELTGSLPFRAKAEESVPAPKQPKPWARGLARSR